MPDAARGVTITLGTDDPADGVVLLGVNLAMAHVSNTWRTRWAHTSIGEGEVDFAASARALEGIG